MEEMNMEEEVAVPGFHAGKGTPHVAVFPSEIGEVEVEECQVYRGLASSFCFSALERHQGIGFQI